MLPPVNLKLQRSPSAKPFIVHYDRVKSWEGEAPKSWLRNVPEHEEFDMLGPLPSLDIEASVAAEQTEDLPVDADAMISNRESEAGDETGNVTETDRDQPVEVDDCVDRASGAQSVEGRPKRAHRRPAYLLIITNNEFRCLLRVRALLRNAMEAHLGVASPLGSRRYA